MISSKKTLSCNTIKLVVAAKIGSSDRIIAVVIVLTNFCAQTVTKKQSNVPKNPRYKTLFITVGEIYFMKFNPITMTEMELQVFRIFWLIRNYQQVLLQPSSYKQANGEDVESGY